MTKFKTISNRTRNSEDYQALFEQLPRLGSDEYISLMENKSSASIPPQVLARAYRQLCQAKNEAGMKATLERLLQKKNLSKVISLIRNKIPPEQGWFLDEDLIQDTRIQIMKVLPTERGSLAETAWVTFCAQRMIDAWRENFGREGERLTLKLGGERVSITKAKAAASGSEQSSEEGNGEEEDEVNPAESLGEDEALSTAFSWHVGLKKSQISLVEEIIERTIDKIQEPLLKQIAIDQFGDDPSPISSGRSENGKPPLTEQTGLSRHQIARRIATIRSVLAGNIRADKELKIDTDWLRKFISREKIQKS
ncbi:MAG TPA: hypothetical protein VF599_04500 [Pyrinomonadaceae bacterium]|jgi:hypothetical protein